uniref:Uncharacterized protein n=1 Tax=Glossina brevipalpis TaxID=37001 RepID=A0A1A9W1I5_9MUSC
MDSKQSEILPKQTELHASDHEDIVANSMNNDDGFELSSVSDVCEINIDYSSSNSSNMAIYSLQSPQYSPVSALQQSPPNDIVFLQSQTRSSPSRGNLRSPQYPPCTTQYSPTSPIHSPSYSPASPTSLCDAPTIIPTSPIYSVNCSPILPVHHPFIHLDSYSTHPTSLFSACIPTYPTSSPVYPDYSHNPFDYVPAPSAPLFISPLHIPTSPEYLLNSPQYSPISPGSPDTLISLFGSPPHILTSPDYPPNSPLYSFSSLDSPASPNSLSSSPPHVPTSPTGAPANSSTSED